MQLFYRESSKTEGIKEPASCTGQAEAETQGSWDLHLDLSLWVNDYIVSRGRKSIFLGQVVGRLKPQNAQLTA